MIINLFGLALILIALSAGFAIGYLFRSRSYRIRGFNEMRIRCLTNAYIILCTDARHKFENSGWVAKLEDALAQIQLYGTDTQIALSKEIYQEGRTEFEFTLDPLINELRDCLRKDMGLNPVVGDVEWLNLK